MATGTQKYTPKTMGKKTPNIADVVGPSTPGLKNCQTLPSNKEMLCNHQ